MKNSKVVLVTSCKYSQEYDELLKRFIGQGCKLICVVGVECDKWEDVIDELAVGDGSNPQFVVTTSHPGESIDEVIEFADMLGSDNESTVKVVRI